MSDLTANPEDRPPFPSRAAYPCFREIVNSEGAGRVWFVMLADGFLLDCGYGRDAEPRARELTRIINEAGTELLGQDNLRARHEP